MVLHAVVLDLVTQPVDVRRVVGTVRLNVVRQCLNGLVLALQLVDLMTGTIDVEYRAMGHHNRIDGRWMLCVR